MRKPFVLIAAGLALSAVLIAPAARAATAGLPGEWQGWTPGNDITNTAAQRRPLGSSLAAR